MKEKDLKLSVSVTSVKSKPTSVIDAVIDNLGAEEMVANNQNKEVYEELELTKPVGMTASSSPTLNRLEEEQPKQNKAHAQQTEAADPVKNPIERPKPDRIKTHINAAVIFSAFAFAISMIALGATISTQMKENSEQKFERLSTELELVKMENLNLSKKHESLLLKLDGVEEAAQTQSLKLFNKLNYSENKMDTLTERISEVDSMLNQLSRSDFITEKTLTEAIKLFASQTTLNSKEYSDGLNDRLREDLSKRHDLLVKQLGVMLAEVLTDTEHREREISTLKRKADKLTSHFK